MEENSKINYLIYPVIGIIAIIVIIVIVEIWSPMIAKTSKKSINTYENVNYEQQVEKYYTNYLNNSLKITNFDNLYEKLDENYVSSLGISGKEEIKEYLKSNSYISMNFTLDSFNYYYANNKNYIIVTYTIKDTKKYITITENSPYDFKLSFMNEYNLKGTIYNFNISRTMDNVDYLFDIVESTRDNIKVKLMITNNSDKTIVYDFSYLDSVQLLSEGNETTNISSIANSNESKYTLTPGSMTSLELYYNIPYEKQLSISGVRINNASINGVAYSVDL